MYIITYLLSIADPLRSFLVASDGGEQMSRIADGSGLQYHHQNGINPMLCTCSLLCLIRADITSFVTFISSVAFEDPVHLKRYGYARRLTQDQLRRQLKAHLRRRGWKFLGDSNFIVRMHYGIAV